MMFVICSMPNTFYFKKEYKINKVINDKQTHNVL